MQVYETGFRLQVYYFILGGFMGEKVTRVQSWGSGLKFASIASQFQSRCDYSFGGATFFEPSDWPKFVGVSLRIETENPWARGTVNRTLINYLQK